MEFHVVNVKEEARLNKGNHVVISSEDKICIESYHLSYEESTTCKGEHKIYNPRTPKLTQLGKRYSTCSSVEFKYNDDINLYLIVKNMNKHEIEVSIEIIK